MIEKPELIGTDDESMARLLDGIDLFAEPGKERKLRSFVYGKSDQPGLFWQVLRNKITRDEKTGSLVGCTSIASGKLEEAKWEDKGEIIVEQLQREVEERIKWLRMDYLAKLLLDRATYTGIDAACTPKAFALEIAEAGWSGEITVEECVEYAVRLNYTMYFWEKSDPMVKPLPGDAGEIHAELREKYGIVYEEEQEA